MAGAIVRSAKAGQGMAKAIIEMVHLMYQRKTALFFLKNLTSVLDEEIERRKKERV